MPECVASASTLPAIVDELTIDGAGQAITISGDNTVRVIVVNPDTTLNLNGLTIANGLCSNCAGGGLFNDRGSVNVNHSTFSGNSAACSPNCGVGGGGIANDGTLTVSNSTFSGNSARGQISVNGGVGATWRRDSREMYFFSTDGRIYAVSVATAGTQFMPGQPQALFRPASIVTSGTTYYPAPDGQRFLVPTTTAAENTAPIQLLLNWPAELESKK